MYKLIISIFLVMAAGLRAQDSCDWMQQYEILRDNKACQLSTFKDTKEEQATALLLACCLHDDLESFKKLESAYFASVRTQLLGLGSLAEFLSYKLLSEKTAYAAFLHDAQEVSYQASACNIQEYLKKEAARYFPAIKHTLFSQRWLNKREHRNWHQMYKQLLEEPGAFVFTACGQTSANELYNIATIAILSDNAEAITGLFESYLKWRHGSAARGRYIEAVCARLGIKTYFNRTVLSLDALSHSVSAERVKALLKADYGVDALKLSTKEVLSAGRIVLKSRL